MSKILEAGQDYVEGHIVETLHKIDDKLESTYDNMTNKENSSNKKTDIDTDKTSNTFFPTVKAVFDWASGLFAEGAPSSTDNAIARFDGATGKVLKNSDITISDTNDMVVPNKVTVTKTSANYPYPAIKINGVSIAGTGSTDGEGYGMYLSYNQAGNRQFAFADTSSGLGVRFIGAYLDGINAITGAREILKLGNDTHGVEMVGSVKITTLLDATGSAGTNGQVLKKVGGLVIWSNP